ncbi:MAG TPA: LytR C-terminal domain-containing protein [Patescibacteria group bacterium]|nr:LytR C-terminal domain-containing protein [Patescibacteria group bacterium]
MSLETPDYGKFSFPDITKIKKEYIIGTIIVIIALVPSIYFYHQYQQAQLRLTNPSIFAQQEVKSLVADVGKLMTLPTDETPTIATVQDKDKLKGQAFFSHAQNGDKVLIYTNAKEAILYRPSLGKIIAVAPVNIGPATTNSATASATQTAATPTPVQVKFVILNGTSTIGLTRKYETELKSKVPNSVVTDTDNAKSRDYATSLLIDVTGTNKAQAEQLAKDLGLTVSPLPAGEATPSSDFLVILGADKK